MSLPNLWPRKSFFIPRLTFGNGLADAKPPRGGSKFRKWITFGTVPQRQKHRLPSMRKAVFSCLTPLKACSGYIKTCSADGLIRAARFQLNFPIPSACAKAHCSLPGCPARQSQSPRIPWIRYFLTGALCKFQQKMDFPVRITIGDPAHVP